MNMNWVKYKVLTVKEAERDFRDIVKFGLGTICTLVGILLLTILLEFKLGIYLSAWGLIINILLFCKAMIDHKNDIRFAYLHNKEQDK